MIYALLSVADKTGLTTLAEQLVAWGFGLLASGGTARLLQDEGFIVTEVAQYTGSPEILGGRVKTLHPKIHGGILARLEDLQDQADLTQAEISAIAVVVVNLYPFTETIQKPGVTPEEAIEQIDIGGVALLRAAAKNFRYVSVLGDPEQYPGFIQALHTDGVNLEFRQKLAQQAFALTSRYDQAINQWFCRHEELEEFPKTLDLTLQLRQTLRYGENPHQNAAWYTSDSAGFSAAKVIQGKPLSFNNLVDLESARRTVALCAQAEPCVVIVKHANPCGVALGATLSDAYQRAFDADSTSAFGGIVALSKAVDAPTAELLAKTFLECIVAPGFSPEALTILGRKTQLRLLELADFNQAPDLDLKPIAGGVLVQQLDMEQDDPAHWQVVTQKAPEDLEELHFAWRVVRQVKSNAIVITKNRQTLGIGAGQMNRVGSAKIALDQAAAHAHGAVLASDGFFPFEDTVRLAHTYGITQIIQPGGSKRDDESIRACDELGLVMVLTGVRHFWH